MKQFTKQLKTSYSALGIKDPLVWQLSNVMVTPETITMTNLSEWVILRNPLGTKETFMMEASDLIGTLSFMPECPETKIEDNKIVFRDGKDQFSFRIHPADDFPKTPEEKQEKIGVISDLSKLKTASVFTSKDELRIALNCVCIREGKIYSTDAHRMYFSYFHDADGDILITRQSVKIMSIFDMPFELLRSEKYLTFSGDGVTIMQRIVDERYPNAEAVIPSGGTTEIKASKADLIAAAERALYAGNRLTNQVFFDLNGSLKVRSDDPDYLSDFSTEIDCEKTGDDLTIGFNSQFFLDIMKAIEGDSVTISLTTPNRAAVINDSFVLMPMVVNG